MAAEIRLGPFREIRSTESPLDGIAGCVDEINAAGGERDIALIVEDNQEAIPWPSTPTTSWLAAMALSPSLAITSTAHSPHGLGDGTQGRSFTMPRATTTRKHGYMFAPASMIRSGTGDRHYIAKEGSGYTH
jgi:hypothetical protein